MTKIKHKFIDHQIDPNTETLIIGTFNPDIKDNTAEFFYSRSRNYLWTFLPTAFGSNNLKGVSPAEKIAFIKKHKIDFIDLIAEIEVLETENLTYNDNLIDGKITEWADVIKEISMLKNLKRIGFTRRTFAGVPKIQERIEEIRKYAEQNGIVFQFLTTPARFYNQHKQDEWNQFLK